MRKTLLLFFCVILFAYVTVNDSIASGDLENDFHPLLVPKSAFIDKGEVPGGGYQTVSFTSEHRWYRIVYSASLPMFIDIIPKAGSNLNYQVILKNSSGAWVQNFFSASTGRAIVFLNSATAPGTYYLHLIPQAGNSGSYEIGAFEQNLF